MSWIADEYQQLHPSDINARGCAAENPFISAALPDESKQPAGGFNTDFRSFSEITDDVVALAKLSGNLEGKKIIVQGLGNVGYHATKFLQEEDGAKIIAILERGRCPAE